MEVSKTTAPEAKMKIRFAVIILVVILSIAGILALGIFGMVTLSSLRAFVGGESVYSKGQQGGAFNLLRYAQTGKQFYYDEFLEHMQTPLADRSARLELDQEHPDYKKVVDAFKQGGNHPEDIDSMIDLFLRFRHFHYVDQAIVIWTLADQKVMELMEMGENLHLLIVSNQATPDEIKTVSERLAVLNHALHKVEKEFSHTLGDASRWAKGLFVKLMIAFAVIAVVICMLALRVAGKMISKMQINARELEMQNWLKTGQTALNETMRASQDLTDFSTNVISFICKHVGAGVGAMYLCDEDNALRMIAGYAFEKRKGLKNRFNPGEGLIGQAVLEKRYIIMSDCPDDYISIHSGLGNSTPTNILAYPLIQNNKVRGAVEIGRFREFTDQDITYLDLAAEGLAIAIDAIMSRRKETALLEKTQQQAEELSAQQEELRATNEELEEHTKILKESEQMLQTQQEELRVTNEELTEQAQTLEKQKQEIEIKNKELEASRHESEEKAKDLELTGKYKSEFLANMSHELRTPLNSVLLLSKLLHENKGSNLTEKQMEFARTIHSSGSDLLNLINEVLDLSKVESGKMELNIKDFKLERFAEKMSNIYAKLAEDKKLVFNIKINPDIPGTIHTDFQRLEQIVKNFISNAIKFTETGGITLSIGRPGKEIILSKSGLVLNRAIAFSVTDTGIGIQKDKQQIIFEAFQQADGSTSRKYGGTGLGLSISRELAACLGGEIQVKSDKGKGSTFTLYLPERLDSGDVSQKIPETATTVDQQDETAQAPAAAGPPDLQINEIRDDRRDLSPDDRSILIIEDDPVFLKTLKEVAQERGFKALVAGDGETGLHLADYYQPSAIILDVRLPGIDGWKVMTRLKESSKTRHIPVHFISGSEKDWDAFRMGAVGYLLKPVSLEQLDKAFATIEELVTTRVKNLMVVEGNETERARIKELLNEKDLSVETIGSGSEAIRRLKKQACHCIILGLALSDMDGTEFLGRIKEDETISHIPVIVYTGKELSDKERVFLDSHSERVITKDPSSLERLFDETALFLHRVEASLPEEKRRILELMHDKESIFKNKTILIVDDDMRNVFALTSILENKGIKILAAKDGQEGVDRVKENPALDLVLMDIMMPEMDGYQAMKKIRQMDEYKRLPIIALTAKAMRGDRSKCIEAGANDYLSKPVDDDKLFSMLRVWLYR